MLTNDDLEGLADHMFMIGSHSAKGDPDVDPQRVDDCQEWICVAGKEAGWKPKEIWIACMLMAVGWVKRCVKNAPDGTQKLITEIGLREQEVFGKKNLNEI